VSTVFKLDPLRDPRWKALVERHPSASVFHTTAWLEALQRTYGYRPVVFTTSPPTEELRNGLVFCRIRSWLTGPRMVSLPFSDHCEPLIDSMQELAFLLDYLQAEMDHREWKYLEVRPVTGNLSTIAMAGDFRVARCYYLHRLDIRPSTDDIFRSLNKKSIQRRIIRAEGAGLVCECGRSAKLLKDFYHLMLLTRSRHQLPPQPRTWFENLAASMDNSLEIRVAYKGGIPVSAILTLHFRDVLYYKYACSDTRFKSLGATSFLLWHALQDSKMAGATVLDLGRSDTNNVGLIEFKNHWVRHYTQIMYWRYPAPESVATKEDWKLRMVKHACGRLPQRLLEITGNLLYRHIG
jgi:lipid II:glycine glycyltransferase (peptidoglycan interpeptide bridge formation enzyme)